MSLKVVTGGKTVAISREGMAAVWFDELTRAVSRRDFVQAARARDELKQLGYDVRYLRPRRAPGR